MVAEGYKLCRECREEKLLTEFYVNKRQQDGYHYYCKGCCKLHRRLEAVRKRDKRSRISYRQYYRALHEGLQTDRTITLVGVYKLFRGHCSVCEEYVVPGEASLDHKVPMRDGSGHTWDNIQLVHLTCNLKKGKMSHVQAQSNHKKKAKGKAKKKSPFCRTKNGK